VPLKPEDLPPYSHTVKTVDGGEIPKEEVYEIVERYLGIKDGFDSDADGCAGRRDELLRMGVGSVYLDYEGNGIIIETDQPEKAPKEIEGIPVITKPKEPLQLLNHTTTQSSSPVYGAVAITDKPEALTGSLTVPVVP